MNEQVYFHKGLAYDSRSALQQPGFLKTCENISTEVDGDQTPRMSFYPVITSANAAAIHSVKRFESLVIAGHGGTLVSTAAAGTGSWTTLGSSFTSGAKWKWREYKKFLHGVNGYESVLIDQYGNCYQGRIENPGPAPTLADSSGGEGPNGAYFGYVSYLITWPNGMQYETGLSPASNSLSITDNAISWTAIPTMTYTANYTTSFHTFNKCVLLLRFNGSDGETAATDVAKGKTVSFAGTAQQDSSYYKFGTASLLLDGDSDYIYVAKTDAGINDLYMGTGRFTIDFWARFATVANGGYGLFCQYVDEDNWVNCVHTTTTNTLRFEIRSGGTVTMAIEVTFTPSANTWYHIALIRGWGDADNGWAVTINGTQASSTVTDADAWPDLDGNFDIGRSVFAGPTYQYFNGWIDDFRVCKGIALWTADFTAPTEAAVAPSIKRKLYRGPGTDGTLADIYYVDTIHDNETTTYTDSYTDDDLAAAGPCIVDDYGPGPATASFIEYHYGRCFLIDTTNPWRLYYAEAAAGDTAEENENLLPIAFSSENYDDLRVSGFEKTQPMGLVAFGTFFFVAFKQCWLKRQGNDPDTWSWKKSWARHGVAASDTIALHKDGIIYLTTNQARECGLAIFNGNISTLITSPKLDYIFNSDIDPDYASTAVGAFVGNYYHLLYKDNSGDWKWLAIDMRRFPEVRAAYWKKVASTELMPNVADRELSAASAWTNVNIASYDETGDLSLTASATGQYCTLTEASAPTTIGKAYILTVDVENLTGTWTVKDDDAGQTLGTIAANGIGTEIAFTAATDGGLRLVAGTDTASVDLDNFSLREAADEARCIDCYSQGYDETNSLSVLIGGEDGRVYHDHTGLAVPFDIRTKDCIGAPEAANMEKVLRCLRYNLNTNSEDVILQIYIDGTAKTWPNGLTYRKINGSGDVVQEMHDIPPDFRGKTISLRIYDPTGHTTMHIYSPWSLEIEIVE
jgi:hypothetical protein